MSNMDDTTAEATEETLTDQLAFIADMSDAVLAMVAGYKIRAMEAGFSEYTAEKMAYGLHRKLLEG